MCGLRGFGPKLCMSMGSKKNSGAPSTMGSRSISETPSTSRSGRWSSRPPKDNCVKRLAKRIWSKKEPKSPCCAAPDIEESLGSVSTASSSSDVDRNLTLGSLSRALEHLLVEGDQGALLHVLESLEASTLADTELPISRSQFKQQFLFERMYTSGRSVYDVVQSHSVEKHKSKESIGGVEKDRLRAEAPAAPAPPKVVIPQRCSILRLCRGARSATPHTGFTNILSEPCPSPVPRCVSRMASRERQGVSSHKLTASAPASHRRGPPSPVGREPFAYRRARSATSPQVPERDHAPVLPPHGPDGFVYGAASHDAPTQKMVAAQGARAPTPQEEHQLTVPGHLPPTGADGSFEQ